MVLMFQNDHELSMASRMHEWMHEWMNVRCLLMLYVVFKKVSLLVVEPRTYLWKSEFFSVDWPSGVKPSCEASQVECVAVALQWSKSDETANLDFFSIKVECVAVALQWSKSDETANLDFFSIKDWHSNRRELE